MAGGTGSSLRQRKTERSRRGTPCCTYRYRMWLLAGCTPVHVHLLNAEVGHIVTLVFRQCRFGQTRLLCQRFQLQTPLHTQVFEPFSQCQLDVHGRTSDVFCTVYHFRRFLSISVEFCSFCTCFPTLWIYGTAAMEVLSYRQKENISLPSSEHIKGFP